MKPIYEFNNYKSYIKALILKSEKSKEEVYSELTNSLGISIAKLGRILEGTKHLSLDRMTFLCIYFSLDDLESQFLTTLLRLNRAVSWQEIDVLCEQLEGLKHEIIELKVEQTTNTITNPNYMECA